jgi:hypothetical protein
MESIYFERGSSFNRGLVSTLEIFVKVQLEQQDLVRNLPVAEKQTTS